MKSGKPEGNSEPAFARNSDASKTRILEAARSEFARFGFSGGRIDRIAEAASSNSQLIYRYFGKKDDLYVAVLEEAYRGVRNAEQLLELAELSPIDGIRKLVAFTFDFLTDDPYFVRLIMNENLMQAAFAERSAWIPSSTQPLLTALKDLLSRGRSSGFFIEIDPVELYIVILSLCFVHVSNKHTLRIMFRKEISDRESVDKRRDIVVRTIVSLLTTGVETTVRDSIETSRSESTEVHLKR